MRDRVFPHFRELGGQGSRFAEYMKDAQLMVQKPSLLVSAVNMIDALPVERTDIKGDLYEYLLGKLSQAEVAATLDRESNLRAQDRIKQLAASEKLIIPGHDPAVMTKFPNPEPGVAKIE